MILVEDEEKNFKNPKYILFRFKFFLKPWLLYFVIICSIKTTHGVENTAFKTLKETLKQMFLRKLIFVKSSYKFQIYIYKMSDYDFSLKYVENES